MGWFLLFLARFGYFWGCQSIRSDFLMQNAPGDTSWDPIEPILWPFWDDEDVPGHPFSRFLNNFTVFLYKTWFLKSIWEKNPTSPTDFVSLRDLKSSFNTILTLFYKFCFWSFFIIFGQIQVFLRLPVDQKSFFHAECTWKNLLGPLRGHFMTILRKWRCTRTPIFTIFK